MSQGGAAPVMAAAQWRGVIAEYRSLLPVTRTPR